jgi:hypothetical protein
MDSLGGFWGTVVVGSFPDAVPEVEPEPDMMMVLMGK